MTRTLTLFFALVLLSSVALALGAAEAPVVDGSLDNPPVGQELVADEGAELTRGATEPAVDQAAESVEQPTLGTPSDTTLSTPADVSALFPGVCKYTCESCWGSGDCPLYLGRPQTCIANCV